MRYTGRITFFILIITTSVTHLMLADQVEPLAVILSCIYAGLGLVVGYLYDKYHYLTFKDPLTKVYNRRYGYKVIPHKITMAKRRKRSLAILNIDIDNFKYINDTFGHEYGDFVLRELCQVLLKSTQKRDSVIRWGGDEFLIIYHGVNRETSAKLANQINRNVNAFMLNHKVNLQLSIGIAIYPEDGQTMDQLISISDTNMYEVKSSSKQSKEQHIRP